MCVCVCVVVVVVGLLVFPFLSIGSAMLLRLGILVLLFFFFFFFPPSPPPPPPLFFSFFFFLFFFLSVFSVLFLSLPKNGAAGAVSVKGRCGGISQAEHRRSFPSTLLLHRACIKRQKSSRKSHDVSQEARTHALPQGRHVMS